MTKTFIEKTCYICDKKFKKLGAHLNKIHQITEKDHYDRFYKKSNEGFCLICDKLTNYSYKHKYDMFCSKNCRKIGVVSTLKRPEVREKINKTLLEKYNTTNISLIGQEKRKKTFLERYGVDHPFKSKIIKDKAEQTCIDRFGVKNVMHNFDIVKKGQANGASRSISKKYKTKFGNIILIQGSYEFMYVKSCEDKNIPIKNGPFITYFFNNKEKKYLIDYIIEENSIEKLIEIKSLYLFEKNKEQILAKKKYAEIFAKENNMVYELVVLDLSRKQKRMWLKKLKEELYD